MSEGTSGFQQSGQLLFNAPTDWTKDDEDMDGNAITNAYYIAIQRTRTQLFPTLPVENYFKIFDSLSAGMYIRGDGVVKLPYTGGAPDSLVNGMIWMEADGLHMYRGGAEYTVTGS